MKLHIKIILCTIIVIAVTLGFGGIYLIKSLFDQGIQRETRQAVDENAILSFAFETIALSLPVKYDRLEDGTIREIAATLNAGRGVRISGEDGQPLFVSEGLEEIDSTLLLTVNPMELAYRIVKHEEHYYINTATIVTVMGRLVYIETFKDITSIFSDRDTGFDLYRIMTLLALILSALVMALISFWLTRPIRILSRASKRMADGNYKIPAKRVSSDELGSLTDDFNTMADKLSAHITELQEVAESRERFVAAFAHELKTPLTSIVGYADILRSRELDAEKSFMSANYIFTEGKRLENLSFRLLDILVLKNQTLDKRIINVTDIFSVLKNTFQTESGLSIKYDEAEIFAEADLIITTLVNITENAVKASDEGAPIHITGQKVDDGYRFLVRDHGCGIPPEEIDKLTQAFYMVDKSRSRQQHGVGLGLTLCADILALHDSKLEIESTLGEGTQVSFVIA